MVAGLIFVGLSWVLSLANGFLGFQLTQNREATSDTHLVVGFVSAALYLMGLIILMTTSQKSIERAATLETRNDHWLREVSRRREKSLLPSYSALGLFALGIITGTLSEGGTFPWVHGALGISTMMVLLVVMLRWIGLHRQLLNGGR